MISGLWLAFIGWFLNNAALMSYRQLVVREVLEDVPVSRLMRREWSAVPSEMRIDVLVDEYLMRGDQRCFPVCERGQLLGLVCLEDIRRIPRRMWAATIVSDIMTPTERLSTISVAAEAAEALQRLSESGVNQLPVMDDGELEGLIRREDILKWLSLYGKDALT